MSFTLVFPSNAQPERYANTAASFQTDLDNAIDVSGKWEVALQDVSYINTMNSLMNESLLLGHARQDQAFSSPLESPKKVVTYELTKHRHEWSDSISDQGRPRPLRSTQFKRKVGNQFMSLVDVINKHYESKSKDKVKPKIKTHDKKSHPKQKPMLYQIPKNSDERYVESRVTRLLNVINNLAPHVWVWRYDNIRKNVYVTMKRHQDAIYGLQVSKSLKMILNLRGRCLLPLNLFPFGNSDGVVLFQPGEEFVVSRKINMDKPWEDEGEIFLTLYPFHRMDIKEVHISKGEQTSWEKLAQALDKGGAAYGFHVTFKKPQMIYDMSKFTGALIHFNEALRSRLFSERDVLWKKYAISDTRREIKLGTDDGSGYRIYLNTLRSENQLAWTMEQDLKLPSTSYNNPHELCAQLNRGDKSKFAYCFSYDSKTEKFKVQVEGETVLFLSPKLADVMGFDKQRLHQETIMAKRPTSLTKNINHYYIYCNFIEPTMVGGKPVPLLRYMPVQYGEVGQTMDHAFLNKVYIPLNVSTLRHCEFGIYDDQGQLIQFDGGRTVLTLHFRRVSS